MRRYLICMAFPVGFLRFALAIILAFFSFDLLAAETFRVATWNVENYLDIAAAGRPAKSAESKAKVQECIRALHADVIAFQEMGSTNALLELRAALKTGGLDYPFWEHISGHDTNIHVAILSKFPFVTKQPHTNDGFLLAGKRFQVSRGFAEVEVRVNPNYSFTLMTAHLKSRRPVPEADQQELREQEALLLRGKIDACLAASPDGNLMVLGDFNDLKDSKSTRTIIGRGKNGLIDTRPVEPTANDSSNPIKRLNSSNIAWTYFYGKEDTYSRIDYIMLSRGMTKEWEPKETYILTVPNWQLASDHRPLVATFSAEEK